MEEKKDDLISVIIPVYNSEKYIERAISSLLKQTYHNVEIIVVDDGSSDKTSEIVYNLIQKDSRITIIQNKSKGVSSARNTGIKQCNGKYIMFLDSDDEYEEDTIMTMHDIVDGNDIQLGVCNYQQVGKNSTYINDKYISNTTIDKEEYMLQDINHGHCIYYGALWNKIYIADIIKENQILFDESIHLGEDSIFNYDYLDYISNVSTEQQALYIYYCNNDNSLTRNSKVFSNWDQLKKVYEVMIQKVCNNDLLTKDNKEKMSYIILANMAIPIDELNHIAISNDDYEKRLIDILDNKVVEFALNNASKLSITEKIIRKFMKNNKYRMIRRILKLKNNLVLNNWR